MFTEINSISKREVIPGYNARFIHTDQMTMAFWEVTAGAVMPVHQHPHEQACCVLEGRFELELNGERREMDPGIIATIPSNVPHGGTAITDCKLLDIFTPVRLDYQ